MTEVKKVYGPYEIKSGANKGRLQVVVVYTDGSRRTMQNARWIMEQHLGRRLASDETVDHIDDNFQNDELSNLRIISRGKHSSDDALHELLATVKCILCNKSLKRKARNIRSNAKKGKAGPFCKTCAGKYSTDLQHGKRAGTLPVQPSVSTKLYKKKIV